MKWILLALVINNATPVVLELGGYHTRATCEKVRQQMATRARVTGEVAIEPPFICVRQWRK